MNIIDKEAAYSPFQMLAFCVGWMDLVLSWENEEQKRHTNNNARH